MFENVLRRTLHQRYDPADLWKLFLIAALPPHAWSILLWLRDVDWIINRSSSWDAVGVGAYGLLFALVEGGLVFLAALLFGFLLPRRWPSKRRVAVLAAFILIMAAWEIAEQAYFVWGLGAPGPVIQFFAGLSRPLVALYAAALALVGASTALPVLALVRWERAAAGFHRTLDSLSTLSMFYLALDALALVLILIRNLAGNL